MATWYSNINDDYTAAVSHDGSSVAPFDRTEMYTLLGGGTVNGVTLSDNDVVRLKGKSEHADWLFSDIVYSLLITSWEDRVPWQVIGIPCACRINMELAANKQTTIEDGVIHNIYAFRGDNGLLRFRNCAIYSTYSLESDLFATMSYEFVACTFAPVSVGSAAGDNSIFFDPSLFGGSIAAIFQDCVFLDMEIRGNAATTVTFGEGNYSTYSQADATVAFGGVLVNAGGVNWSHPVTAEYPEWDSFSQETVDYALYGLPFHWTVLPRWATGGYSVGWWLEQRRGFGAFAFDMSSAFSATPNSGKAPLQVDFTGDVDGAIEWEWDFGDGSSSSDKDTKHTYAMPGEYVVKVCVSDVDGNVLCAYLYVYVYDFDYSGDVPNASLTSVCYRTPVRGNEGFGVSEYRDSQNPGRDWIWPPANIQIGKGYDKMKREIALVLDSKTQREYRINDFDAWREREGVYEGNIIDSEMHQKAHFSDEGEHIPIRHIEHHLHIKSFDRLNMQNQPGYDSVGLPIDFEVDNQLYQDEEPFTPIKTAKDIQPDGDLVFPDKAEARNLQLRTIFHGAPYLCTGVIPYYETVDKQQSPLLRVMSEDGYQANLSGAPLFHVSRNYNPLLNLATGAAATGTYASVISGPDGKSGSALSFGVGDLVYDNCPRGLSVNGDFSVYLWVKDILAAVLPIQLYAFQNLSVEIHDVAGTYQLLINHNGEVFTTDLEFHGVEWTMITVAREGLNIRAYENKTLLDTFVTALAVDLGTTLYFAPAGQMSLFDPCVVPRALSLADITYYYDDIIRGGDEVLQPFGL